MIINFKELQLKNFKSHQQLKVDFGELTLITGDNAVGKSTIPEAISFTLYGTDTFGSKLDPTPITYAAEETRVDLSLSTDEKEWQFGRELRKGKTKYYVNEVPVKATEFNAYIEDLFDKELFFSLFNPHYFFSLHWEKQRAMILRYVTPPSNKEVFKALPDVQANKLAELVKKTSLEDLNKIHRDNKNKMDKAHIAAQSRTKTLEEQLTIHGTVEGNLDELQAEEKALREEIEEADKLPAAAFENNNRFNSLKSELDMIQYQIDTSKEKWTLLKNEPIKDTCNTCKQPLQGDALQAVEKNKTKRMDAHKEAHQVLIDKKAEIQEKMTGFEFIDVTEEREKVMALENDLNVVLDKIRTLNQRELLTSQIKDAQKDETDKLNSLNESIFIIDAIKDFKAKEAEMQANKVQDLFDNLSIRLFTEIKSTGDLKPTFVVQMDDKDYMQLSTAEKIKAGLELRDVLSDQSGLITPCFVDNAESITKFKSPNGQLIQIVVVAGQELKVESKELST